MIAADLGRAALFASIPVCYALHALTLAQLFAVDVRRRGAEHAVQRVGQRRCSSRSWRRDRYMDGQSLIYGSRALSFVGGPSIGGVLVQAAVRPVRGGRGRAVVPRLGVLPGPDPAGRAAGRRVRGLGAGRARGSSPVRPLVRASLIAAATLNFFNLMFAALYLLYAVRVLHIRPGLVGVLLGAGAVGARARLAGHQAARGADRGRAGRTRPAACCITAPLVLWPLAHGAMPLVLAMLFAAEFVSGFGVMVLDISIGAIFAAVIPDRCGPG